MRALPILVPICGPTLMPPKDPPRGVRFSLTYLNRGEPTQDSRRMRQRIAALIYAFDDLKGLGQIVPRELGVPLEGTAYGYYNWNAFLDSCELRDVLDLVTVAFQELLRTRRVAFREFEAEKRWVREIQRIFSEENLSYSVDDLGGVHFRADAEFAHNSEATIAALRAPRYANALHAFEAGISALSQSTPDGKSAIRQVFGAAETIFKLILPNAPRLGAAELEGCEQAVLHLGELHPHALSHPYQAPKHRAVGTFPEPIPRCHDRS
jgi:hypothetical protein